VTTTAQREWWRPDAGVAPAAAGGAPAPAAPEVASSRLPFVALVAFTFILLMAPQNFAPVLATLRIALLAAAVAIGSHIYDRWRRGRPLTIVTREIRVTGWLLVWTVVTIPFSMWPGGSVGVLLDQYIKTLAIFMVIANTVNTESRLRVIAFTVTILAMPLAVTGVQNFLSGAFMVKEMSGAPARILGYDTGIAKNPNDLALILNQILPVTLALAFITRRGVVRLLLLAAIGMEALGIGITFSRAGFISLATTGLVFAWTIRRRPERSWIYVCLTVLLLATPLLPEKYFERLSTIGSIESDKSGSSQNRYAQQVAAVHYVIGHPVIGAGLGMNNLAMNDDMHDWLYIHNVYLQYAVDFGLPGLILYVMLMGGSIKSARAVQLACADLPHRRDLFYLAAGVQTSLLTFAASAFFSPVAYHFQFYYFAGLAVAVKSIHDSLTRATPAVA